MGEGHPHLAPFELDAEEGTRGADRDGFEGTQFPTSSGSLTEIVFLLLE